MKSKKQKCEIKPTKINQEKARLLKEYKDILFEIMFDYECSVDETWETMHDFVDNKITTEEAIEKLNSIIESEQVFAFATYFNDYLFELKIQLQEISDHGVYTRVAEI